MLENKKIVFFARKHELIKIGKEERHERNIISRYLVITYYLFYLLKQLKYAHYFNLCKII